MSADPPCAHLAWDSEFWGVPIATARHSSLTSERAAEIDAWCADAAVACVYLRLPADDRASIRAAEAAGFALVDVRVELELVREAAPRATPGVRVRVSTEDDLEALEPIARVSHRATRFYADERFPDERCDDLYGTWLRVSYEGFAAGVLAAEQDGRAIGYVTCHLDENIGAIGLIAVDASARARGTGQALVSTALAWLRERGAAQMTVASQGSNIPALRLFERCGFSVRTVDLTYHKWFDPR